MARWRVTSPRPVLIVTSLGPADLTSVATVSRANAFLVSRDDQDRPVYGGTPSDFAVVQAIHEMKARGLRVTFYPFILMDVPPGNSLPNPYSDNASETGQLERVLQKTPFALRRD